MSSQFVLQRETFLTLLIALFFVGLVFSSQRQLGPHQGAARMSDAHAGHHQSHDSSMDHSGMSHGEMMPMPMYFINTIHTTLWFQRWETKSLPLYIVCIVGLIAFGVLHEFLASYRATVLSRVHQKHPSEEGYSSRRPASPGDRLLLTALYTLNVASGFMIMLAVMTFNVGCFFAVTLGMGLGYYLCYERCANTPGMAQVLARSADSCHVRLLDNE